MPRPILLICGGCLLAVCIACITLLRSNLSYSGYIVLWQIFHTADEPPPKFPAPFIAARNAQITAAVTAQRNHFALSQAPISFPTVQRRVVVPTIYRSRTFSNGAPARFVSSGYYNGLPIQGQQITEYPSVSEAASSSPLSPLVTFVPTALETSQTAPIQNHLVPVDVGDERPAALISKNLQNQRSFDVNVADDDQNPSSMIVPTAGFSSVAQNYVFDTLSSMPTASVQVPASTTPEIRPIDSSLREHTEELAHPPALQVENMGIESVKPSAPTLSDSSGLYTTAVYKILAKEQDLSGSKPINGLATSNAEQSAAPIFRSNSGSGFDDNGNDSDGTLASNGASNSNVNSGSSDLVRLEHVPSEVAEVGQQDTVSAAVRKGYRAVDGQYSYAAPVPLDAAAAQVPTRSTTSTLLDKFSTKLPMVTAEDAAKNALMSGHQTMNLIQQRAAHLRTLQPPSPDSTAIESQAFPRTAVRGQDAWIHKGWPAAVSRPSIPSIPEASIPAIPETWPQFQSHQALASPSKSSLVAAGAALAAIRASKAAESAVPSTRPATFELSQTHMPRLHEAKSVAMQRVARKHAALAVKARAQSLVRAPRKMSLSGRNVHGAFAERVFDSKMTRTFGEVANTFPDTTESAASIASVGSAVPRARLEQVQAKGAKPLATALVPAGVSPGGFFSASAGELGVMLITVPAGARAGSTLGLYRVAAGDGSTLEWLLQPATGDAVHASGAGSRRTRAARQGGEPVFSGLLQLPEALATAARSIAGSNKESTGPDMPLADGGPVLAGPKGSKMGVAEQGPRARLLSIDDVEKMSQWQSKELQQLQAQQAPADSRTKLRRSHRDGRDTIMRKDVDGVEHEAVTARGSGGKPVVIGEQTVVPQCSKVFSEEECDRMLMREEERAVVLKRKAYQAEQRAAQLLSLNARLREDTEKMLSDQQQQEQEQEQEQEQNEDGPPPRSRASSHVPMLHQSSHRAQPPAPRSARQPVSGPGPVLGSASKPEATPEAAQVAVPSGLAAGAALDVRLPGGGLTRVEVPAGAHAGSILKLVPLRLGVTVPPSLRPGEMLDVVVPAGHGVGPGYPGKVRVRVPNRLGPARSLEVDVWTARLAGARG